MNSDTNPILSLAWTFGVMSLFAVGGANAAIPEMHRLAVDVQHWMTDKQFADVFAISQLSPGPNAVTAALSFAARFGFCWCYLTKIGRQVRRNSTTPSKQNGREALRGERDR